MSNNTPLSKGLTFEKIQARIQQAKYTALKAVNKELIELYSYIGAVVFTKTEKGEWGAGIVTELSEYIRQKNPGIKRLL